MKANDRNGLSEEKTRDPLRKPRAKHKHAAKVGNYFIPTSLATVKFISIHVNAACRQRSSCPIVRTFTIARHLSSGMRLNAAHDSRAMAMALSHVITPRVV